MTTLIFRQGKTPDGLKVCFYKDALWRPYKNKPHHNLRRKQCLNMLLSVSY